MTAHDIDALFERLWTDYATLNAQVGRIVALFEARGEQLRNDHIALRTFRRNPIGIDTMAASFVAAGYVARGDYQFPDKRLWARHFEAPGRPKVFISELDVDAFSAEFRGIVDALVEQVSPAEASRWDLVAAGRLWQLSMADYDRLRRESEYAAWLGAFGFRANHFTVDVTSLRSFATLAEVNQFLLERGFELNRAGGLIKGTPQALLEQSSTLAQPVRVDFADGRLDVPACYYEFARRYPDASGQVFQGFIATSANRIFESTDQR
jgi:hypothetical protein